MKNELFIIFKVELASGGWIVTGVTGDENKAILEKAKSNDEFYIGYYPVKNLDFSTDIEKV